MFSLAGIQLLRRLRAMSLLSLFGLLGLVMISVVLVQASSHIVPATLAQDCNGFSSPNGTQTGTLLLSDVEAGTLHSLNIVGTDDQAAWWQLEFVDTNLGINTRTTWVERSCLTPGGDTSGIPVTWSSPTPTPTPPPPPPSAGGLPQDGRLITHAASPMVIYRDSTGQNLDFYAVNAAGEGELLLRVAFGSGGRATNPYSGKEVIIEFLPAEERMLIRTYYADAPHAFDKAYIFTIDASGEISYLSW